LDFSGYNIDQPQGQILHGCTNQLINLGPLDVHGGSVWLDHNKVVDGIQKQIDYKVQGVKRKSDELNMVRKLEQERVQPALVNMTTKTDQTLMKTWTIQQACDDINNYNISKK
jgi:hypothetical protein